MNDLYKAIDSLKDIIAEEESTVNEKIDLKLGNLPTSIYIVNVKTNQGIFTNKVLKK